MQFVESEMPKPDDPHKKDGDPLAEKIGAEIAGARKDRGLSVSELHRQTSISRTVLQGYEAGRYKPGAREICLLAQALDCSPNRLLFGHDDFRKRTNLDELFGNAPKATNATKIGIMAQMLKQEEQAIVLGLLTLMIEERVGGRDNLSQVLSVADQVMTSLHADETAAESRLRAFVGEDAMKQIGERMSEKIDQTAQAATVKKPKRD